ncbi:MAG: hypothetical protein WC421_03180 [Elusimicrobiales bacterium]
MQKQDKPLARESLALFRDAVLSPAAAFTRMEADGGAQLRGSAALYAAYLLVSLVFYWLKPADFPAPVSGMPSAQFSLHGWLAGEVAGGTLFVCGWVFLLSVLAPLALRLRAAFFLPACAVLALAPAVLMAALRAADAPAALFPLAAAAFYAAAWFAARRADFPYRKMLSLLLLTSSLEIISLAAQTPAVILRQETLYLSAQIIWALWILALTVKAVSRFCGIPIARAAAAVFSALVASFTAILALANGGLISKSTLAMFFAG